MGPGAATSYIKAASFTEEGLLCPETRDTRRGSLHIPSPMTSGPSSWRVVLRPPRHSCHRRRGRRRRRLLPDFTTAARLVLVLFVRLRRLLLLPSVLLHALPHALGGGTRPSLGEERRTRT